MKKEVIYIEIEDDKSVVYTIAMGLMPRLDIQLK